MTATEPLPGLEESYRDARVRRADAPCRAGLRAWLQKHRASGGHEAGAALDARCPFDPLDHPNASGHCDGTCCPPDVDGGPR